MPKFRDDLEQKFLRKRRKNPKKDFEFLTRFERKSRTCHKIKDLEHFCAGFKAIADEKAKEGS